MITPILLATLLLGQSADDPLAPAAQGKVQCYAPNVEAKTCTAIASYEADGSGGYSNTAITLIAPSPAITMTTVSPVTVKGDAVCGYNRVEDFEAAEFDVDGAPLPAAQANALSAQLIAALQPMIGPELCTSFTPDGDMLRAETSFDGEHKPEFDTKVIWVSPDEGYRVAP